MSWSVVCAVCCHTALVLNITSAVGYIELLNQIRCKQNMHILISTLWLRAHNDGRGGGGCRARRYTLFILGTMSTSVQFSSDKGRFVWRYNTFLSQAVVFANGILLALASGVNKMKKQSVHLFNVQSSRKNKKSMHYACNSVRNFVLEFNCFPKVTINEDILGSYVGFTAIVNISILGCS